MINRLNFYDIYGYLFPGAITLLLLLTPGLLTYSNWPPFEWEWIALGLPISYAVGHLIRQLGTHAIGIRRLDSKSIRRYHSDIVLDSDDNTLVDEQKRVIAEFAQRKLKVTIVGPVSEHSSKRAAERAETFYLCRSYLGSKGVEQQVEQMQGMSAAMRGASISCALGAAFTIGWNSHEHNMTSLLDWVELLLPSIIFAALLCRLHVKATLWVTLLLLAGCGAGLAQMVSFPKYSSVILAAIAFALVCFFSFFLRAYRHFEHSFVTAVYRDYVLHHDEPRHAFPLEGD